MPTQIGRGPVKLAPFHQSPVTRRNAITPINGWDESGYACYRRPQSLRLNVFRFVGALQGFRQFECRCGRPLIGNSSNLWLPRSPTTLLGRGVFLNITNWETPYSVSLIAANWRLNYQIIKGSSRAVMGWRLASNVCGPHCHFFPSQAPHLLHHFRRDPVLVSW